MSIDEQLEAHRGAMRLSQFVAVPGVSYDCGYDWITKCGLPATKINGTYWIDPYEAARWWREHSTVLVSPTKKSTRGKTKAVRERKRNRASPAPCTAPEATSAA
jgi:hypothetical protein